MGAGVPRPVRPKSQTHRIATEKPSTDGTTASHRHEAVCTASTLKPSQEGNSQNQRAKKAQPTNSDAIVVGQLVE